MARRLLRTEDCHDLTCLESICGNVDKAIEHLRGVAQGAMFNREWARKDPEFEWIRDDPRFREVVGEDGGAESSQAVAPDN